MKTWNRLISLVLTGAILLAVPLTSFATGANNKIKVVSKTKSSQFQVATVEVDGKTIIAEYDPSSKHMMWPLTIMCLISLAQESARLLTDENTLLTLIRIPADILRN